MGVYLKNINPNIKSGDFAGGKTPRIPPFYSTFSKVDPNPYKFKQGSWEAAAPIKYYNYIRMFRKLIKKLKKKSVYWRIAIVYIIFLIVKWFMYEIAGIEIGKEGFNASSLVARINGGATELAKLCTKQQVKNSSSSTSDQKSNLKLKECDKQKLRLREEIASLKNKLSSKALFCKLFIF